MESKFAKWSAAIGGGSGCVIILAVSSAQVNLAKVLNGELPFSVAIALNGNSFTFLLMLLLLCVIGVIFAFWRPFSRGWLVGVIWLGIGSILAYAVYVSRFSIGPLLVLPTASFIMAGGFALSRRYR